MSEPSKINVIRRTVEESRGEQGQAYIRRVLTTAGDMRSHVLAPSARVTQWMKRVGLHPERFESWVTDASQASGLSRLEVSLILKLFTEDVPGIHTEPVCGDEPRCGDCPISAACQYYTGSGRPTSDGGLVARHLLSGAYIPLHLDALLSLVLFGKKPTARQNNALKSLITSVNGKLAEMLTVTGHDLITRHGLTESESAAFMAMRRLFDLWRDGTRNYSVRFSSAQDFFDLYHFRLRDLKKEQFWVVLTNQQNRFIGEEQVSEGTLTEAPIHPREVFAPAIRSSAAAVAFVHNHPGGDPNPSEMDIDITHRLTDAAKILDIRVLDHVIIAPDSYYSFAEHGELDA